MKGYKGFNKGLVCRGKQYAENTVFEENEAVICEKGMHFCENPLDVLDYYPLLNDNAGTNEFCEVETLDEPLTDDNKKFVTRKLKIGTRLSFSAFVKAAIDFVFEKTQEDNGSGDSAKLASSGDYAKLASSGKKSVVCGIGYNNIAKAARGSWITLAEYDNNGRVVFVRTEYVDGKKIKADTWYKLKNEEFVEV